MKNKKIKSANDLKKIVAQIKASGKTVGFTNGCFDILHYGHVKYLEEAKNLCHTLIVAVNSDGSVKALKGTDRPINGQTDRIEIIAALAVVDYTVIFDEDTPCKLIEMIDPDFLFKGGDWKECDIAGSNHVKSKGGTVKIIPFIDGYSTTELIEKMRKNG